MNDDARIIWDYHHMHQPLSKADAIFVLCSNDIRVAEYAADLFLQGYAPLMIFSGGIAHNDDLLSTGWSKPEAEIFADIALRKGMPKDKIIIENQAQNTGENIALTKQLLAKESMDPASFILVQKPYMERRTYATFMKQWPEKDFTVTSPPLSFEEYPNDTISQEILINIMVGDLQRIKEYPVLGYQIEQEIPGTVWDSLERLVKAGFDRHLIKK